MNSDEEATEVKERGQQIAQEMMGMSAFISSALMSVAHRLITTTAWEDADAPKQMLTGGAHKAAMDRFFGSDFAAAATKFGCQKGPAARGCAARVVAP